MIGLPPQTRVNGVGRHNNGDCGGGSSGDGGGSCGGISGGEGVAMVSVTVVMARTVA